MDKDVFERAKNLKFAIEEIKELRNGFLSDYPDLSGCRPYHLDKELLSRWSALNISFLEDAIETLETEFEEL